MRRVVVTGMGIVSPLGNDLNSLWKALITSKSGVTKLSKDDLDNADDLEVKIGGKVIITTSDMEKLVVFFN